MLFSVWGKFCILYPTGQCIKLIQNCANTNAAVQKWKCLLCRNSKLHPIICLRSSSPREKILGHKLRDKGSICPSPQNPSLLLLLVFISSLTVMPRETSDPNTGIPEQQIKSVMSLITLICVCVCVLCKYLRTEVLAKGKTKRHNQSQSISVYLLFLFTTLLCLLHVLKFIVNYFSPTTSVYFPVSCNSCVCLCFSF